MSLLFVFFLVGVLSAVKGNENKNKNFTDDTLKLGDEKNGLFWEKINTRRLPTDTRSFQLDSADFNLDINRAELAKLTLKEFLDTYAKKLNKKHPNTASSYYDDQNQNDDEIELIPDENINNFKSWSDDQQYKRPYDDKKGWVSLDPIPWSVSKISKWRSKYKPSNDRWDEIGTISDRPYLHNDDFKYKKPVSITPPSPYIYHNHPTEAYDRYDSYFDEKRRPSSSSNNNYVRPPSSYGHNKVHAEAHFPSSSFSSTARPYFPHHKKDCNHPNHPYDDIITDGLPSNFPHSTPYEAMRRKGTEMSIHHETYPLTGDGEWVLLSTTKGYKPLRNKQRSLNFDTTTTPVQALSTTRGIRLTVLPPLKNSNINMTTSHGGLLQVESTQDSVEQAKRKHDNKQINISKNRNKKRRKNVVKRGRTEEISTNVEQHNDATPLDFSIIPGSKAEGKEAVYG